MKKIFYVLAAVLAFVLAGCKSTSVSQKAITPSALCGEWKIASLSGCDSAKIPEATLSVMAREEDEYAINGFSGVNRFFANLKNTPDAFPIGDRLASTKMMGAPDDMTFEDVLTNVIAVSSSWKIEGNTLKITAGTKTAVFVK